MNFLKKAIKNKKEGKSFHSRKAILLWESKVYKYRHLLFEYGFRRSEKYQLFPVWVSKNNTYRTLQIGLGTFHISFLFFGFDVLIKKS